jgi:hypothetical protein
VEIDRHTRPRKCCLESVYGLCEKIANWDVPDSSEGREVSGSGGELEHFGQF